MYTTRSQRKRKTKEHLEPDKRLRERYVDNRFQIQLKKIKASGQDRAGWSEVVCGLGSTGSDKA